MTLCIFLFGWIQVVVWEPWPVSLIGWGARCVSQELKLPPKHRVLCPRANRIWQSYCDMKLKIRYIYMEVLAFSQKDKMLTSRLFPGRDCRHLLWLLVVTTLLLLVNLLRLRSGSFVKSSNTLCITWYETNVFLIGAATQISATEHPPLPLLLYKFSFLFS